MLNIAKVYDLCAACPEKSRILPPSMQAKLEQPLGAYPSVQKKNTYFL